MWTVQEEVYDEVMDFDYDPMDPAAETSMDHRSESRRLSQDEQIKAHEASLANEARRIAELEREQQELERLQRIAFAEEQSRLEQEREFQLAQLEIARFEEEKWRRLQLIIQQQQQQQLQFSSISPRKEVGFADSALLYSSDRSHDEVHRMWYSKDELAAFKNDRKVVVKALKRANFDVATVERSGKFCLRGYEAYFSLEVNKAMKDARTLVTSLVLTEQERQRRLGIRDDEALRFACSSVSQWACDNALKLGDDDEVDVYGMYESAQDMDYLDYVDRRYENDQYDTNPRMDLTMDQLPPMQQHHSGDESNDDNLVERLDSALKLIRVLRSGTQSDSNGL
jgi:hypothetical protein